MTKLPPFTPAFLAVLLLASQAEAQTYAIPWWTVDGGGVTFSTGGTYSLGATIGQPDASAPLTGGTYSLTGGFWAGGGFTADLAIVKNDGQSSVMPGQLVTYTITVTNNGPDGATGATVADTLPAALEGATWSCVATPGSICTANGVGGINDSVTLLAAGTLTYSLSATVASGASGILSNTATVAAPPGVFDGTPGNNSSTDEDTIVLPVLAINDVALAEGNAGTTIATFTVTLSPAPMAEVTVNFMTQDVSALAGSDYVYTDGTLTFLAGQTSKPIPVTVNGDTAVEPSETFQVVLSGPSAAVVGDGVGVGTITNDDTPVGPSRVFVSVLGLDTNDCSDIATPCRTLNAAMGQAAEHGEVVVIRSGSYAGATVTKSIKLNGASGVVAFSAQPITVNAPSATVLIRGLTLKAVTPGTGTGILVQDVGSLFLENDVIDGWDVGVRQQNAGEVFIKDSIIRNNQTGFWATTGKASLDNVRLTGNNTGIRAEAPDVSVRGSMISGSAATGIAADSGASVTVEKCQIADNAGSGIAVDGGATARVSRSVVSGNGIGLQNVGGDLFVYGNNAVRGNTTNTSGTITTTGLQ